MVDSLTAVPYSSTEVLHRIYRHTGMNGIQVAQNQKRPEESAMAPGKKRRHNDSLLSSQSNVMQNHAKVAKKRKESMKRVTITVRRSERLRCAMEQVEERYLVRVMG